MHLADPWATVRKLLERMATWVATLKTILYGEYPDFEVLQAYQIFQVPRACARSVSAKLRKDGVCRSLCPSSLLSLRIASWLVRSFCTRVSSNPVVSEAPAVPTCVC